MMSVLLDKMKTFETSLASLSREADNPNFVGDLLIKKAYFSYLALGLDHEDICDAIMAAIAECYQIKQEMVISPCDIKN